MFDDLLRRNEFLMAVKHAFRRSISMSYTQNRDEVCGIESPELFAQLPKGDTIRLEKTSHPRLELTVFDLTADIQEIRSTFDTLTLRELLQRWYYGAVLNPSHIVVKFTHGIMAKYYHEKTNKLIPSRSGKRFASFLYTFKASVGNVDLNGDIIPPEFVISRIDKLEYRRLK